jgi:hypothetical protein
MVANANAQQRNTRIEVPSLSGNPLGRSAAPDPAGRASLRATIKKP